MHTYISGKGKASLFQRQHLCGIHMNKEITKRYVCTANIICNRMIKISEEIIQIITGILQRFTLCVLGHFC